MNEDEQIVEETTTSPSEEEQTTTEETPVVEETKSVPYDRFKEVIEERNKYKELLGTTESKETVEQPKVPDLYPVDEIDKIQPMIDKTVNQKFGQLNRQIELDRTISKNPDFFKYADTIKAKIQETPNLSWEDAYRLAKFDSSVYEAKEAGKKEALEVIQQKKKATVESAVKTKSPGSGGGEINPLAKGPDGKFIYSTKELEDFLKN